MWVWGTLPSVYLVDVADHKGGEEYLRQRSCHGVYCGHHRSCHEVDGVPVEKKAGRAQRPGDYQAPEYHPEDWQQSRSE